MTDRIARHLVIHGLVQGVGYREAICKAALGHGLGGWVRNRSDGTVEALLCGPAVAVQAIVHWARRGPRLARVTGVDVTVSDQACAGFQRLPNA
jgi:acylphosphatase